MEQIAQYAPVLGAYDRCDLPKDFWQRQTKEASVSPPFGNPKKPRYATAMTDSTLGWTSEQRGTALVVSPRGRVDESTADAFRTRLLGEIESGPSLAVIDLSGIDYMSSRGLRALTLAQRAAQSSDTTIVLARPGEAMREILAISRYDMVFKVTDTIEDAVAN